MEIRNVVVTGAAGALGKVVVERLHAAGFAVAAIDIGDSTKLAREAVVGLGGVDLTDEAAALRAFDAIAARLDRLDGLVNVAGAFAWETVADGSIGTWDRLYALNVKTVLNASRGALQRLNDGGSIVNIGAAAAARAEAGMAAYAASKSAVTRLTEGLAAELRPRRIRVNAVLPSIIDTPANRVAMPDADFAKWVTPTELAHVIAFLLSHQASGINGAAIPVIGRV